MYRIIDCDTMKSESEINNKIEALRYADFNKLFERAYGVVFVTGLFAGMLIMWVWTLL